MIANRLLKWLRVVGSAVVIVAVPVISSNYVLDHHALSTGRAEVEALADNYLHRAEAIVGEALTALTAAREQGHASCALADRQAFGDRAFRSVFIQQIGLADRSGALLCSEPMGALAAPLRIAPFETGDPLVMIGAVGQRGGPAQIIVALRVSDEARLVARIKPNVVEIGDGPAYFDGHSEVAVKLDDGATWWRSAYAWRAQDDPHAVVEQVRSSSLPITVMAAASPEAMRDVVLPLRRMVLVLSAGGGLLIFGVGLWTLWRHDGGGDEFALAVRNGEFVPFYQPVVDIYSGRVHGCELLVRWVRPDGTTMPPNRFLPYAEATGQIVEITRQLMVQAREDLAAVYSQHRSLKLSVNLTASHFNDFVVADQIAEVFGDGRIGFSQLVFEVTEQHPLKDLAFSRKVVDRIKECGASVALDDVGTGHGGLAYLQKLGVDVIKIDKMFVDDIGTDRHSEPIVHSLVELAGELNLGIVAEGVEREDQVTHLKRLGVTAAQGYLYAPPLSAPAYLAYVREHGIFSQGSDDLDVPESQPDLAAVA